MKRLRTVPLVHSTRTWHFINQVRNPYISNYHGLQMTLTGGHYHSLSFVAGYTYSHALDDMTFSGLNFTPQDSRNLSGAIRKQRLRHTAPVHAHDDL